jgi:hypothetical protein
VTSPNGFNSKWRTADSARVSNRNQVITGQEVQFKVRRDNTTWVIELSEIRAKEQA